MTHHYSEAQHKQEKLDLIRKIESHLSRLVVLGEAKQDSSKHPRGHYPHSLSGEFSEMMDDLGDSERRA